MVFSSTDDIMYEFARFLEEQKLCYFEEDFNESSDWDRHAIYENFADKKISPDDVTATLMLIGMDWLNNNNGIEQHSDKSFGCSMIGLMKEIEEDNEDFMDDLFDKFKKSDEEDEVITELSESENIAFHCSNLECGKGVIRDSREHDESACNNNDEWFCPECNGDSDDESSIKNPKKN